MYLLFYSIAIFVCMILLIAFNHKSISIIQILLYVSSVYILGIYGSRILAILECHSIRDISFKDIFSNESGLTFYGGYIPISTITFFFLGRIATSKVDYMKKVALFAIVFHLGYAIGRLGCHYSADGCYGNVTFSKFGIRYTWGIKPTLFPVYPTALFEAAINAFVFLVFSILFRIKKYEHAIYLSLVLFPLSRFLMEFIRNNSIVALGLTLNQIISLFLIFIQPLLFFILTKKIRYENTLDCHTRPV